MHAVRPAIYVASLLDFNNGILHGAWIDATIDPAELQALVDDLLAHSPTTRSTGEPAEEFVILDTEGFGDIWVDPDEALADIQALARAALPACRPSISVVQK